MIKYIFSYFKMFSKYIRIQFSHHKFWPEVNFTNWKFSVLLILKASALFSGFRLDVVLLNWEINLVKQTNIVLIVKKYPIFITLCQSLVISGKSKTLVDLLHLDPWFNQSTDYIYVFIFTWFTFCYCQLAEENGENWHLFWPSGVENLEQTADLETSKVLPDMESRQPLSGHANVPWNVSFVSVQKIAPKQKKSSEKSQLMC